MIANVIEYKYCILFSVFVRACLMNTYLFHELYCIALFVDLLLINNLYSLRYNYG